MKTALSKNTPSGWKLGEWCRRVGISRPTFYRLSKNQRPLTVKLRHQRLVLEDPTEFLRRLAADQAGQ